MRIYVNEGEVTEVGYQAENERTEIAFPLADMMEEFPGGWAMLVLQRPKEKFLIAATSTQMEGTDLVWTVQDYEVRERGYLRAQVVYAVGQVVAKTRAYKFHISESLITIAEDEDTWTNLVGKLVSAAATVASAVTDAEETIAGNLTQSEAARDAAVAAQEAAEAAQELAEAAQGAAETAQETAETAKESAEEAVQEVRDLIDSIVPGSSISMEVKDEILSITKD